ncbi:MAG: hypothetical protein ACO1TE_16705 [Prosthecobacter sp.]
MTHPAFLTTWSVATAFLVASWALGRLLLPLMAGGREVLGAAALRLGWGLLFWAGCAATWLSGRFCYGSLVPLLQLGMRAWWLWQARRASPPVPAEKDYRLLLALLLIAWPVCALIAVWQYHWSLPEGFRALHGDLGYAVQLALGLPEAQASSHWAATLGSTAVAGAPTEDVWYHWAPVWLAAGLAKVTGLPAMVLMYRVMVAVLSFELLLLAAAMVRRLSGMRAAPALLAGAASLIGVQWIKMFGVLWLSPWLPFGTLQHSRLSLLHHFPYQFEAMVILMAITAWQFRQRGLAALLWYLAGLSSPHNVAVMGVAAGTLLGLGVLLRRRDLWQPAMAMVFLLLAAWGTLKWGFQVDLPKAAGQPLLVFDWRVLLGRLQAGVLDAGVGLLLQALLLPGLICLIRQKDRPEAAALGWLALSALVGSYLAYHLLRHVSDIFHLTMLAHAALVMPVSLWGLACLWQNSTGGRRILYASLITLSALMGMHDIWHARSRDKALPFATQEMDHVRAALAGRPFGYFTDSDRQWWISKHCTLASFLGSRCVRLNGIPAVDGDHHSQYYGAARPRELVPPQPHEADLEWSLRLARRLSVHHLLETGSDLVPDDLKPRLRLVCAGKTLRLYELP